MSTIGKILVILNLILAVAFVGSTATLLGTSGEWKAKHDALAAQLKEEQAAHQKLLDDVESKRRLVEDQLGSIKDEKGDLAIRNDALNSQIERLEAEKAQQATLLAKMEGTVADIQAQLGQLRQLTVELQDKAETAQMREHEAFNAKEKAEQAMFAAKDELKNAKSKIESLTADLQDLRGRYDKSQAQLDRLASITGIDPNETGVSTQKPMDATVRAVNLASTPPFVILDVGGDQGVERGYLFDVFSGSTYKGRVRVDNVEKALCSATLEMQVDGVQIAEGDQATTRLP